jgi:hypothetical protein
LDSVAETNEKRTSKEADEILENAIKSLGDYKRRYLSNNEARDPEREREKMFLKRMDDAKSKDQSRSGLLSVLKAVSHSKVRLTPVVLTHTNTDPKKHEDELEDKKTFLVEFFLQESLPSADTNTTLVPRVTREIRLAIVVSVI